LVLQSERGRLKALKKETGKIVGVISDTHSLLRPEALAALQGVDLILHAGDVGNSDVLEGLRGIAPVVAVRGNNDKGQWAEELPQWEVAEIGVVSIYMIHDLKEIDLSPAAAGFQVVVSGHSHQPSIEERKGVLYLNPGSAGPRRFSLPICLARLRISGEAIKAELVNLVDDSNSP
jgi:putative phosphoesterase